VRFFCIPRSWFWSAQSGIVRRIEIRVLIGEGGGGEDEEHVVVVRVLGLKGLSW
jgi:hypothetical protein